MFITQATNNVDASLFFEIEDRLGKARKEVKTKYDKSCLEWFDFKIVDILNKHQAIMLHELNRGTHKQYRY